MMPPCLLAALRYTSLMQSIFRKTLVLYSAKGLAAERSKFNRPHFRHDRGIFQVRIFSGI